MINLRRVSILTWMNPLLTMVVHWMLALPLFGVSQGVSFFGISEMSKLGSVLVFVDLIFEREGWRFDIIAMWVDH
jgi:hypothetical protein